MGNTTSEICFKIPMLPPSMNSLYSIIFSKREIYMKPEVRAFKTQAKLFVPAWSGWEEADTFSFEAEVHDQWFYKNGKLKKADVQNLTKVLIDLVCEKLGIGDERIWEETTRKVQSEQGFVLIKLRRRSEPLTSSSQATLNLPDTPTQSVMTQKAGLSGCSKDGV